MQKLHYQITPISPGESLKQKGRTIFSTSAVLKRDTCSPLPRPTSTATRDQTRGKWGLSPRRHRRKTEPNIRKGLWYRNTTKTTRRKKKTAAAGCYGAAGHNVKPLWATAGSRKRTPFYHYNYQCVWISASSYLEKKIHKANCFVLRRTIFLTVRKQIKTCCLDCSSWHVKIIELDWLNYVLGKCCW